MVRIELAPWGSAGHGEGLTNGRGIREVGVPARGLDFRHISILWSTANGKSKSGEGAQNDRRKYESGSHPRFRKRCEKLNITLTYEEPSIVSTDTPDKIPSVPCAKIIHRICLLLHR